MIFFVKKNKKIQMVNKRYIGSAFSPQETTKGNKFSKFKI